jgi:lysozyme
MAEILGIDVSHWQGNINWDKAKAAGIRFAFCKASEGNTYFDDTWVRNYSECKRVGIKVGAYHFVRMNVKPILQLENIKRALGSRQLDFFALDCETADGMSVAVITQVIWTLAGKCKAINGSLPYPFIYTSKGWWDPHVRRDAGWDDCPLWVANWNVHSPTLPADWKSFAVWQYTVGDGSAYGVQGRLDMDRWNPAFPFPGDEPQPPPPPAQPYLDVTAVSSAGKTYKGRLLETT